MRRDTGGGRRPIIRSSCLMYIQHTLARPQTLDALSSLSPQSKSRKREGLTCSSCAITTYEIAWPREARQNP